ncbi:MAG: hypothetical protein RMX68_011245 [Aulosira sp. ZfuVER01]|nr:hypothetical protein [Aulosira sp. ZfuVER01]MDZ7996925.1 hypothetical protein [Aulosira sp. DedVER01a]MDZ8050545.1 hypothetical protein [Aulosira sp. ZfuCHP01]
MELGDYTFKHECCAFYIGVAPFSLNVAPLMSKIAPFSLNVAPLMPEAAPLNTNVTPLSLTFDK